MLCRRQSWITRLLFRRFECFLSRRIVFRNKLHSSTWKSKRHFRRVWCKKWRKSLKNTRRRKNDRARNFWKVQNWNIGFSRRPPKAIKSDEIRAVRCQIKSKWPAIGATGKQKTDRRLPGWNPTAKGATWAAQLTALKRVGKLRVDASRSDQIVGRPALRLNTTKRWDGCEDPAVDATTKEQQS